MSNILLIHGWDYDNYYGRTKNEAWNNRISFVKELEKSNNIYYMDLPGFGLRKEPNCSKWNLDDFAKFIHEYINKNNLKTDYILGYSFGGAIAIRYKKLYNLNIKEILISPAIVRNNERSKKFFRTPMFLKPIRDIVRNFYLVYVVKNEEMKYGTNFLKNTYQNIVRINMLPELESMRSEDFLIIYGKLDTMVNPKYVENILSEKFKKRIKFIDNGSHNIAVTHTKELVDLINKFK